MFEIDCCGLSCPIPVVNTKKALKEHPEGIKVTVDNSVPMENVCRFARTLGYNPVVTEGDGLWTIEIKK